jgi:Tol biopolymer transport system component
MKVGSIHWIFALGLICSPAMARADVALLGRLTAPVTGDQLTAGAQAASISPDGRYLAFVSTSSNMGQPSDGSWDVYLYDLETDEYLLATAGLGSGNSYAPSVSEGGLAVAFQSEANDLVAGGTSGVTDLFYSAAYDAGGGAVAFDTYLVSRGLLGVAPNGASQYASISGNGRYVAFLSYASNLIAGDTNSAPDIFVGDAQDLFASPPERVSVGDGGVQIEGYSRALSPSAISSDGRYVAFAVDTTVSIDGSNAGTLEDVFVRDRTLETTSLMSKSTAGIAGSGSSDMAAISPNGRYVVFRSFSTNLVASLSGSLIYVRDRQENTTTNMPLPPGASSCEDPRISDFGDIVAQCNMSSGSAQAFLYKPAGAGAFYQLSTSTTASAGNGTSGNYTGISANGVFMVFDSAASDLVPDDTNNTLDVFVAIPEPDAASGWLVAISALAVAARRRSKRRSR